MVNSLFTALSGLKAHQDWLGVIGNNLANTNTPGFKSSRAVFSDLFSQTLRFASQPQTTSGGRNPVQVGLGTQIGDISRNMSQGALTATGRPFDLALNGSGWFVVSDGASNFYTRVGTFGLDASGTLVDQRTGFQVIGRNNQRVALDTTSSFPPAPTTQVDFTGNLPAVVTGPLAQVQTSASGLLEGTPAQMTGTAAEPFDLTAGTFSMDIIANGGAPTTLSMGPGTFQAIDVANAINALSGSVTATAVGGQVQIQTNRTGANTSLRVLSGPAGFDLAAVVGLDGQPLQTGTESVATGLTDLNVLSSNLTDYVNGDLIDIAGNDTNGSQVSASFRYGVDGTTVNDLVTFIDGPVHECDGGLQRDHRPDLPDRQPDRTHGPVAGDYRAHDPVPHQLGGACAHDDDGRHGSRYGRDVDRDLRPRGDAALDELYLRASSQRELGHHSVHRPLGRHGALAADSGSHVQRQWLDRDPSDSHRCNSRVRWAKRARSNSRWTWAFPRCSAA